MEERQVFGTIPFDHTLQKRKIIFQLKTEFGQNLKYWIENNLITYESSSLQKELAVV